MRSTRTAVPLTGIMTLAALSLIGLALPATTAFAQGGVFVTGHDPDFHGHLGGNTTGARNLINDALTFVTQSASNNHAGGVLLVTDLTDPGGGYSDPRLGLDDAGVAYTVADYGSGTAGVLDLSAVDFSDYSAVVVASDFGGWLRQSELSILDSRSADLLSYINGGGGLVAFAESGPGSPGLTTGGEFGFLPFLTTTAALNENEVGNTVTPFGATLGLTDNDINGNASHNIFLKTGGMGIVDNDAAGNILSLAAYGRIDAGGVTPEPSQWAGIGIGTLGLGMLGLRARRRRAA